MAKTRAVRRAVREADRAARIAAARERQADLQRRADRSARWKRRFRIAVSPGLVARTRRRRIRVMIFLFLFINAVVWSLSASVAATAFSVVVSLLIAPMIVILIGRSR